MLDEAELANSEPIIETESLALRKTNKLYEAIKQCFDFAASLCAGVLLAIPMALIALIISVKDFGNPFYKQKRVGKDGKDLYILKFRSMRVGADHLAEMLTPEQLEEYNREYKLKDDPRLIGYKKPGDGSRCFGAMLRRTSIDELPQIVYNICLKRNMSVVGPRPILQQELEENYSPEQQKQLLSVKPGLTGYWQAYARNNATYETGERQKMELYYVQNRSWKLDTKILFQTVISVIRKTGAE